MSRCFPFPPPGYVMNGGHDEAMIDSIKGVEEKCKKEHKSKERKRDKKEKKEKKDKKRKEREVESDKHSHKRRRKEEDGAKDVQNHQKVDVKESEKNCLEKSSVTVERELVQSTSQNSCDSTLNSNEKEKQKVTLNGRHNKTDSSLNSNELPKEKEKQPLYGRHNSNELPKEKQPLVGRHNNNNNNNDSESIIRIRLPIRRPPKDPEVITNKDHQPCPSREIKLHTSKSVTREQQQHLCSTSAPEHASKPHEEEKRKEHTSKRKHKEKKLSSTAREALQFLNVVENWVPTSRVELTNSEDEECWWLMKKPSSHKFDKQQVNRNNETNQVVSTTWPRASLLPEADVYALPYTVPF